MPVGGENYLNVSTAFASPAFLLALVVGLVGGLLCVLRPESVRAFAVRYTNAAVVFSDPESHRRFIQFCGWVMLALAVGLSLASLIAAR